MKSAAHQYEDKLLEFAYGELPQHEADAVDAHVRGCARCSQALTEIRGVRATMAQLPMVAAPDAGLESLLAYAGQAAGRNAKPAPSLWKRFLTPLASVMALVTVGVIAFRANQEFDTSPASAAADQTVKAREARLEQQNEEARPPVQAQAPAPVAATAVPVEAALKEEARKQDQPDQKALAGKLDDTREQSGKRGDVWSPQPSAPQAPQSVTRRSTNTKTPQESPKELAAAEAGGMADDYSNAAARGGLSKKPAPAPPPPPPAATPTPEPAQDKNVGFGLTGGSAPGTGRAAAGPSDAPSTSDESYRAKSEAAPAPAPAPSSAPAPSKKAKSSYTLKDLGTRSSGSSSMGAEDDVALEKTDSLAVDRDAKFAERQRADARTQSLESARVASNRGDRLGEIRLLTQVLQGGATGYERVEALKRLCDAYEALGEFDRADPFCDQLLTEFPNTVAAKVVAQRRNQVQRAPPKSAAPARMERERKAADLEQVEPKPAEAAPAQAY